MPRLRPEVYRTSMIPGRDFRGLVLGRCTTEQIGSSGFGPDPRLRVTVVFTTAKGTVAALRAAGTLARDLGSRILLVAPEIVPVQFPVDDPPVAIPFLEQRQLDLVSESGVEAEEVRIEIYLCRDRSECLRIVLRSPALVVIGGRRRWWSATEREMENYLRTLGHRVNFVEMEPRNHVGSVLRSYLRPVFRRVLDFRQGL